MQEIDGKIFVEALCKRLDSEGRQCHDSTIVNLLSKLTKYELRMLVDFGTTDKWVRDATSLANEQNVSDLEVPTDDSNSLNAYEWEC